MTAKHCIASVISYCTNDYRYLAKCLEEAKKFSHQVLVVTCDHFFSGEPEDRELLDQSYAEHPECEFLELTHTKDHLYNKYINRTPKDNDWMDFWHSTTRYAPFFFLKEAADYVLFLDSDEIIESDKFMKWLDSEEYRKHDAIRWLQYYYFREARYRAKDFQIGGLLAKKSRLRPSLLMDTDDRCGIFQALEGNKREGVSLGGIPMVHHYSWVKTKEECLLKSRNWSHHWERDWKAAIEEEFSRDFNGKDFHDRSYVTVEKAYFDPLTASNARKKINQKIFPNVRKVTDKEIQRRELAFEFNIPFTP